MNNNVPNIKKKERKDAAEENLCINEICLDLTAYIKQF